MYYCHHNILEHMRALKIISTGSLPRVGQESLPAGLPIHRVGQQWSLRKACCWDQLVDSNLYKRGRGRGRGGGEGGGREGGKNEGREKQWLNWLTEATSLSSIMQFPTKESHARKDEGREKQWLNWLTEATSLSSIMQFPTKESHARTLFLPW